MKLFFALNTLFLLAFVSPSAHAKIYCDCAERDGSSPIIYDLHRWEIVDNKEMSDEILSQSLASLPACHAARNLEIAAGKCPKLKGTSDGLLQFEEDEATEYEAE